MKRIYLAVAVLVLVPLMSGAYLIYTENRCDEIVEIIQKSTQSPEGSEKLFNEAKKKWDELEKILALSANHSVIDKVNESFTKAEEWQKLGSINMFLAEAEWLKKLVRHVGENEKLKAYNIF